mmetsp:Transcript_5275/g.6050  ORF Transcript_5275/g.6050 Transcript_5275/m.6050 type:complete len:148 (+) Transcript_5275:67-510(+)
MEDIYADLPPPKGTASVAPLVGAGVKRKRSLQDPGGDEKKPLLHEQTNPVSKAEEESRPQNDSKEDLTTDGIVRKLTKVLKETKKEKKQIKAISLLTTLLSSDADLEKNSKVCLGMLTFSFIRHLIFVFEGHFNSCASCWQNCTRKK